MRAKEFGFCKNFVKKQTKTEVFNSILVFSLTKLENPLERIIFTVSLKETFIFHWLPHLAEQNGKQAYLISKKGHKITES